MAFFKKNKNETGGLPDNLPGHIAFIMDGNGRWAKKRAMPRRFGHREGAKNFRRIARYCKDIGIKNISFYAFSTENWKRPKDEVEAIIELFREYIVDVRNYIGEEVRVLFLGDKSIFDEDLQKKMNDLEEDTKDNREMTMLLAINYGGRDEIVHAAKILADKAAARKNRKKTKKKNKKEKKAKKRRNVWSKFIYKGRAGRGSADTAKRRAENFKLFDMAVRICRILFYRRFMA